TTAPPLASTGVTVSRKLAFLVDRCLRKEPDDRPATANNVAEQLTVLLEQRKEIPVALRSFIKRAARLNSTGTLIGAIAVVPASVGMSALWGAPVGWATLIGLSLGIPFLYMTDVSRRLVMQ